MNRRSVPASGRFAKESESASTHRPSGDGRGGMKRSGAAAAVRHVAKVRVSARTGFMEEISDRKMEA
jgi:hypothetical protein